MCWHKMRLWIFYKWIWSNRGVGICLCFCMDMVGAMFYTMAVASYTELVMYRNDRAQNGSTCMNVLWNKYENSKSQEHRHLAMAKLVHWSNKDFTKKHSDIMIHVKNLDVMIHRIAYCWQSETYAGVKTFYQAVSQRMPVDSLVSSFFFWL